MQYGRSDSYRVATTQDKDDDKDDKKGKAQKVRDLDDLKKEVAMVSAGRVPAWGHDGDVLGTQQ